MAARSPSPSSPARKRQRLSSPTYDDQVDDISDEHLQAFDLIEARLSQATSSQGQTTSNKGAGPSYDLESPFFTTASALKLPAVPKPHNDGYSSDEFDDSELAEKEKMYDSFLDSTTAQGLPMFQSAKLAAPTFQTASHSLFDSPAPPRLPMFQSAKAVQPPISLPLFAKAFNKENQSVLMPSKEALLKAQQKMKIWEKDWVDPEPGAEEEETFEVLPITAATFSTATLLPPTSTPSAPSFSTARIPPALSQATPLRISSQSKPFRVPTFNAPVPLNATPGPSRTLFKMPAMINSPTSTPLRLQPRLPLSTPGPGPSASLPKTVPTPRSIGLSRTSKSAFKTPFKKGVGLQNVLRHQMLNQSRMTPASPLSSRQNQSSLLRGLPSAISYPTSKSVKPLPKPAPVKPLEPPKMSLSSSGLRPQEYDAEDLASYGINVAELKQITPSTATHYGFYTLPSPSSGAPPLNAEAAYQELLAKGCDLATKPWVDNHWCLILWKLAGMVALDPDSENDAKKQRWCWSEVMRQLTYRYEKELNKAQRPALRRIVATDSPAGNPLVLCVSAINWFESEQGPFCELEVTDGWYRLKAHIDAAMSRAVRKRTIRVGRKIAVVGARLLSEKKDPMEILEAYDSVKLVLSGNSTNLAPWHAKLGFQHGRRISTLRSLSADGGFVSCIDIEVLKVHPVAYLEFVERDGQQIREGPQNAADEARAADQWMKRREKEASKLRYDYEKQNERYMDYSQRLENKARSYKPTDDDGPPDSIDAFYDDLEDHQAALRTISQLTPLEAYWLSKTIQQNLANEHDRMSSEVEKELAVVCPPRNVRNFRVLVVKDARTDKKPSHRTAQLTVWDAANLALSESGQLGAFQVGQRYMVSNLVPTQMAAWMDNEPGAEIYMATRKGSQWLRVPT